MPLRWFKFNKKSKRELPKRERNKSRGKKEQQLRKKESIKIRANRFVSELVGDLEKFYEVGEILGNGGYGKVYACVHKETGTDRAVKIIPKSKDVKDNAKIQNEFKILKDLDHPNILKNYAMFQNEISYYIVTDRYSISLFDHLSEYGTSSEEDTANLMRQMLGCLNFMHKNGVAHRDLKLENILLVHTNGFDDIKIIDFGFAARFDTKDRKPVFDSHLGSVFYMAPQVYDKKYSAKCDIWACGVIAYMVLSGYAPFDGDDDNGIIAKIVSRDVSFDDVWHHISSDAITFVDELLTLDEANRPSAEQSLQHRWITKDHGKSNPAEEERRRSSARSSLASLQAFTADSKLKQAICSLIASQLLSHTEKVEIDHIFRRLDVDCDGKLSEEDLRHGYKEHFDTKLSDDEIDEILEQVNYSCSGAIEYSEFIVATMMEKQLVDQQKLKSAFRMFDKEGKGYISYENLYQILSIKEGTMQDYVTSKILKPADRNADGQISLEEFIEAVAPDMLKESTVDEVSENATNNHNNARPSERNSSSTSNLEGTEEDAVAVRKLPSLSHELSFSSLVSTVEKKLLADSISSINIDV